MQLKCNGMSWKHHTLSGYVQYWMMRHTTEHQPGLAKPPHGFWLNQNHNGDGEILTKFALAKCRKYRVVHYITSHNIVYCVNQNKISLRNELTTNLALPSFLMLGFWLDHNLNHVGKVRKRFQHLDIKQSFRFVRFAPPFTLSRRNPDMLLVDQTRLGCAGCKKLGYCCPGGVG